MTFENNNDMKHEMSGKITENAGGTADEDEQVYTISCKLPTQVRDLNCGSVTPESRLTSEINIP